MTEKVKPYQPTIPAPAEDLLSKERNFLEWLHAMLGMMKNIPEAERGGAKIKAELIYEKEGGSPKLGFKITF